MRPRLWLWAPALLVLGLRAGEASGLDSNMSDVVLTGTLVEDLTIVATPAAVAFTLNWSSSTTRSCPST